jgi:hypothetical protein
LIFFSTHVLTHWTWISYMIRSYLKRFKKG